MHFALDPAPAVRLPSIHGEKYRCSQLADSIRLAGCVRKTGHGLKSPWASPSDRSTRDPESNSDSMTQSILSHLGHRSASLKQSAGNCWPILAKGGPLRRRRRLPMELGSYKPIRRETLLFEASKSTMDHIMVVGITITMTTKDFQTSQP